MEKIIKIGSHEIPVKSTASALLRYKLNFGRDAMQDLTKLAKGIPKKSKEEDVMNLIASGGLDIDIFYRFIWVFAKTADSNIKPLTEWLDDIDVAPFDFIAEVFPQIQELLYSNIKTTIKSKN